MVGSILRYSFAMPQAEKATYQSENTHDVKENQFDMLKKLELSYEDFRIVQEHCRKIGIDFLSTPDEEHSLAFLMNELHLPIIKIGSGEVTNIPYLRAAGASSVALLHCTTNYPCPKNEVNLRAMQTMREAFKCQVGYSDHTMGTEIPIAAVALGAEIIEKHFTLDRNMEGPDHKASLEPQELKYMVDCIRNIEVALGDGIKKGDILSVDNITIKRAGSGISAAYWDMVVGTKALHDFEIDELIKID